MIWIMHFVNFISHFIRATQFFVLSFYLLQCCKSLRKQFGNTSGQLLGGENTCNMDFKPRKQMDEW